MLQRIQTLYLLLAMIAIGSLFFFPLAELLAGEDALFIFRYTGLYGIEKEGEVLSVASMPLAGLYAVNLLLGLLTVFLFRNRILQMRVCVYNIILLVGSIGLFYYYIAISFSEIEAVVDYKIFALMPIIAAILTYLAFRSIKKDEILVKSVDRIR